jgi:hypothetical protein
VRGMLSVLLVLVGACYHFVAVNGTVPADGAAVQVELTAARDVMLQDVTVHNITAVQGRLLAATADSVAVAVTRLWGLEGRTYEATGIGVSLPREGIAAVREQRLSPARSGLAVAAGSAAVVAMILSVRALLGSGGGSGHPPPPP